MKKIFILFFIALTLTSHICSCSPAEEPSKYESLSSTEKAIVDKVMKNKSKFSNCNTIRFKTLDGTLYFVATRTEFSNNPNSMAGTFEEMHFFTVGENYFSEKEYDASKFKKLLYGGSRSWSDSWSEELQRETLAAALIK